MKSKSLTNYIVATIKPWHVKEFKNTIRHFNGIWSLITDPKQLTAEKIKEIKPKYIFFPHWSNIVPNNIIESSQCVCFHETDLPYGRGGSPIQNLIARGHRETFLSAIRMIEELDAGPIFMKKPLSLEGSAEEIYLRSAKLVSKMIEFIINTEPVPKKQIGKVVKFKRRNQNQSKIPNKIDNFSDLYDHIRMLDAETYPNAFIDIDNFRFEIDRASLRTDKILANVRIIKKD